MMSARHFLSLMDCTPEELVSVIRRGIELKDLRNRGVLFEPLKNRVLGMIFEKSSTRTRVSFEAGMIQLGGQAIFLSPRSVSICSKTPRRCLLKSEARTFFVAAIKARSAVLGIPRWWSVPMVLVRF